MYVENAQTVLITCLVSAIMPSIKLFSWNNQSYYSIMHLAWLLQSAIDSLLLVYRLCSMFSPRFRAFFFPVVCCYLPLCYITITTFKVCSFSLDSHVDLSACMTTGVLLPSLYSMVSDGYGKSMPMRFSGLTTFSTSNTMPSYSNYHNTFCLL